MKVQFLMFPIIIFLSGCSQKEVEPKIEYVYKTQVEYIYVPCKKEEEIQTKSEEYFPRISPQKKIKEVVPAKPKKLAVKKSKPKYKIPKPTKIYAPKKYIKTPNKKMDFMVGINKDGSEFIYMEGAFGMNTAINFKKFVRDSGSNAKEVKINSNGGVVLTAMEIGAFVKENRWNTGVDKEMRCMSACTFVYFAGRYKSLEGKAVLGLHRPYIPGVKDTPQSIAKTKKDYISYWNYIHAPKSIYDEMMQVGRDDLFILDRNNVDEYIDVNIK